VGLSIALGLVGAIAGFVLGELFLPAGRGLFVAPASALVGVILARALWITRPRPAQPGPIRRDGPDEGLAAGARPVERRREARRPADGPRRSRTRGKGKGRSGR
jgi:hypothetical protein